MAQGKKVVAIDIGGTKIASALVTLEEGAKPVVEFYDKIPTEAKKGGQQVLANAIKMARRVIELAGEGVCGIGGSAGGGVDPRAGGGRGAADQRPAGHAAAAVAPGRTAAREPARCAGRGDGRQGRDAEDE